MKSYLHLLENNEAILLMYLANELPAQDRADVKQMLASDAGLRAELESIRQLHEIGMSAMHDMDRDAQMPVAESVAVRQVMRMIYRRQANSQKIQPAPTEEVKTIPWWRYSLATAAMLLIGFLIWWGMHPGMIGTSLPAIEPEQPMVGNNPNSDDPQNPNWPNRGPHQLTSFEKMAILGRSLESSTADDGDNVQMAVVASKTEDADLNLDPSRFTSNP